jgi:hypothetical protein
MSVDLQADSYPGADHGHDQDDPRHQAPPKLRASQNPWLSWRNWLRLVRS